MREVVFLASSWCASASGLAQDLQLYENTAMKVRDMAPSKSKPFPSHAAEQEGPAVELSLRARVPPQPEDCPDIRWPDPDAEVVAIPLGAVKVSAGFPSPAADYEEKRLDINDYLIKNSASTFFFPVQGDSMQGAEIFDGDILVVDKSVEPQHGHIVVAFVDGERLVKRLYKRGGRVALIAENPAYPPIQVTGEMEMIVWGVVVGKFKRLL